MVLRAIAYVPRAETEGESADAVTLDYDLRHRRRIAMTAADGLNFLLDLPRPERLRDGDQLLLEDGRRVRVIAAPEPLAEIRASGPGELVRIAWHLGNRHLPVMLEPERILIRRDHVIEDMAAQLGATVRHVEAPFDPEPGAYAGAGGHHHHHHDDLGHDHPHDHSGHSHGGHRHD
jgi:urease accessory protein